MDLKDVVQRVRDSSNEAELAFRAGHQDVTEKYLMEQMIDIGKYFDEKKTPEGDVTKSATSEKPEATSPEKPAQAQGPAARAVGVVPFADPSKPLPASQFGKQNQ